MYGNTALMWPFNFIAGDFPYLCSAVCLETNSKSNVIKFIKV